MAKRAFAVVAHPDDIEFMFAGTLLLLGQAGYELHYMNIANGNCGTNKMGREEIERVRTQEARNAASKLGATFHPPIANDVEIFFNRELLAKVAAVMREVAPEILLVHSPDDYMEDHMNACRLAVSGAFTRGMPNYPTDPPRQPVPQDVTIYHAQPWSNRGQLNQLIYPHMFVNIESVIETKRVALAEHKSQKDWLDESQGLDSYLDEMVTQGREVGGLSGQFKYAEGWRRHNPQGYCSIDADPLRGALKEYVILTPEIDPMHFG
ncbi:MAG: PIG-L deacetylase family protein [Candidatus Sumerlaeaceae bacterium]